MIKDLPPLSELAQELSYNPLTGEFVNVRTRSASAPKGAISGSPNKFTGYLTIRHRKKLYLAHRLAWLFSTGQDPGQMLIDHINGNRSDNRFSNLRLATCRQNLLNSKRPVTNTTGFKGVVRARRGRFLGRIRVEGGLRYTPSFKTVEEAAKAYADLAREVAGEFLCIDGERA